MKRPFFSGTLIILLCTTLLLPENKVQPFEWLHGSWTMKVKRGTIMESWHAGNDSTIIGENLLISPTGQTTVMENLRLAYENGNYYYINKVRGQNDGKEIKFKITSYNEKGFVSENPEHDFPKRIVYELINKDSIYAWIDGGPAEAAKRGNFYYSRYKN